MIAGGRHLLVTTLLASSLLALTAGCAVGAEDDELAQPRRTITSSPAPARTAVPAALPVGDGPVSQRQVVWSHGTRLHVGRRSTDVAPLRIDSFVVVPGGVYLLDQGELWFTDLTRVRGTGLTRLAGLDVEADRSRIRVTTATSSDPTVDGAAYTYDVATGRRVSGDGYTPESESDRLGRQVRLRVPGRGVVQGRQGPGRHAVGSLDGSAPLVVDTVTGERVPLRGAVPTRLRLAGWAGPHTFYGTSRPGSAVAVVSCDARRGTCAELDRTSGGGPVRFGSGT